MRITAIIMARSNLKKENDQGCSNFENWNEMGVKLAGQRDKNFSMNKL